MSTFTPAAFEKLTRRLRTAVANGAPIPPSDLELLLEWCALIHFPQPEGATLTAAIPSHLNQSPTSYP